MRQFLTEALVDSLSPPEAGERWIADTEIRGFGLRLWRNANGSGAAFCVRAVDSAGKPTRRTFKPFADGSVFFRLKLHSGGLKLSDDGTLPLSAFLSDARVWAREVLQSIRDENLSASERERIRLEHEESVSAAGSRIRNLSLRYLVDLVIDRGYCRGWNDEYRARLANAFVALDRETGVGSVRIADLGEGRLEEIIQNSSISEGNLRALRSLFNTVLWNVHSLGAMPIAELLPTGLRRASEDTQESRPSPVMSRADAEHLIDCIKGIDVDWRAKLCIELCVRFHAPVVRVMQGRWRQIHDGSWFPYGPQDQLHWYLRRENIYETEFACLVEARKNADAEGITSPYWFPRRDDPTKPISGISRAWRHVLRAADWPQYSLKACSKDFKKTQLFDPWDIEGRASLRRRINEWQRQFNH